MSISSAAEDSALRLAPSTGGTAVAAIQAAAAAAAQAAVKGDSADVATAQGQAAGEKAAGVPAVASTSQTATFQTAAATAVAAVASGAAIDEATKRGQAAGESVAASAGGSAVPSSPLAALVKYIPTETLALYVAVQAALGDVSPAAGRGTADANFRPRWIAVGVFAVLTLVLTLGLSYRSQVLRRDAVGGGRAFKVPIFEVCAATLAFLVWALSLPDTPLQDLQGYNYSAWSGVQILAGTIVIGSAAYIFGKNVSWQKVS